MGTNYYWFKEKINIGEHVVDEGLHIGKLSAGWVFHFQAHPNLGSYADYKKLLQEGYIYDEYNDIIPNKKFIKLVESTRSAGWKFSSLPEGTEQTHFEGIDEWEDEGFMFTCCDFC